MSILVRMRRSTRRFFGADLRGDIGCQHLGELVVLEATLQELLLGQAPIIVLIHPAIINY